MCLDENLEPLQYIIEIGGSIYCAENIHVRSRVDNKYDPRARIFSLKFPIVHCGYGVYC